MRKSLIGAVIAALPAMLSITSCNDGKSEPTVSAAKTGTLELSGMDVSVNPDQTDQSDVTVTSGSRNDSNVDVGAFVIDLLDGKGQTTASWTYADKPSMHVLPVGSYTLEIRSHKETAAAFERPLYMGSREFEIKQGTIYNIGAVTCSLASVKVTIRYSDELAALMDAEVSSVKVTVGSSQLTYPVSETRPGYFHEGKSLVAEFSGVIKGNKEQIIKTIPDVKPGHHYIITFAVKSATGGYVDPKHISIDTSVTVEHLGYTVDMDETILDSSDRPNGGNGGGEEPSEQISFTSSTLSFTDNNPTDLAEAKVLIHADKGISSLVVDIISDDLTDDFLREVGLASTFDLAVPGEMQGALAGLGFPTGAEVTGKTDVTFDITQFLPLLDIYQGVHKFHITVTDADGNKADRTLSFIVE